MEASRWKRIILRPSYHMMSVNRRIGNSAKRRISSLLEIDGTSSQDVGPVVSIGRSTFGGGLVLGEIDRGLYGR